MTENQTSSGFDPFSGLAELALRNGLSMVSENGFPAFSKEWAPAGRFGLPSSRPNSSEAKMVALEIARNGGELSETVLRKYPEGAVAYLGYLACLLFELPEFGGDETLLRNFLSASEKWA